MPREQQSEYKPHRIIITPPAEIQPTDEKQNNLKLKTAGGGEAGETFQPGNDTLVDQ